MCSSGLGGLTDFGKNVVKEMDRLGMIIDVSHLSEVGFWDVVKGSKKPFVASHSNSKTVWNHPRNLTDEQFGVFVERQGLVGINFYPVFLNGSFDTDVEKVLDHIDHFLNLGGDTVIAMGSDFDGAKMPEHIDGIQDVKYLYHLIVKRYGTTRAEQFFYENAYRFFTQNL